MYCKPYCNIIKTNMNKRSKVTVGEVKWSEG